MVKMATVRVVVVIIVAVVVEVEVVEAKQVTHIERALILEV